MTKFLNILVLTGTVWLMLNKNQFETAQLNENIVMLLVCSSILNLMAGLFNNYAKKDDIANVEVAIDELQYDLKEFRKKMKKRCRRTELAVDGLESILSNHMDRYENHTHDNDD